MFDIYLIHFDYVLKISFILYVSTSMAMGGHRVNILYGGPGLAARRKFRPVAPSPTSKRRWRRAGEEKYKTASGRGEGAIHSWSEVVCGGRPGVLPRSVGGGGKVVRFCLDITLL